MSFPHTLAGAAALKFIMRNNKTLKHWDSSYLFLVLDPYRLYLICWYSYFTEVHTEFQLSPPPQRLNASFFPCLIFINPIDQVLWIPEKYQILLAL